MQFSIQQGKKEPIAANPVTVTYKVEIKFLPIETRGGDVKHEFSKNSLSSSSGPKNMLKVYILL